MIRHDQTPVKSHRPAARAVHGMNVMLRRIAGVLTSDAAYEAGWLLLFGLTGMLISARLMTGEFSDVILAALSR